MPPKAAHKRASADLNQKVGEAVTPAGATHPCCGIERSWSQEVCHVSLGLLIFAGWLGSLFWRNVVPPCIRRTVDQFHQWSHKENKLKGKGKSFGVFGELVVCLLDLCCISPFAMLFGALNQCTKAVQINCFDLCCVPCIRCGIAHPKDAWHSFGTVWCFTKCCCDADRLIGVQLSMIEDTGTDRPFAEDDIELGEAPTAHVIQRADGKPQKRGSIIGNI